MFDMVDDSGQLDDGYIYCNELLFHPSTGGTDVTTPLPLPVKDIGR